MTDIGPVQLLAIGYGPEARYEGQILDELQRLEGGGLVRVLDLLFVGEDLDEEELVAFDYQGDSLGALVGALLGFAFEGDTTVRHESVAAPPGTAGLGLTRDHLERLIREAPPDYAVGLALIEHVWARDLKRAVKEAGGVPLAEGFLSEEAIAGITRELEEVVRTLDQLEQEEAAASATD